MIVMHSVWYGVECCNKSQSLVIRVDVLLLMVFIYFFIKWLRVGGLMQTDISLLWGQKHLSVYMLIIQVDKFSVYYREI